MQTDRLTGSRFTRRGALCALLAFSFVFLLLALPSPPGAGAVEVYNEVYGEALQKLNEWNILQGYADGQLHPERYVTRAQFVAMINRAYGYKETGRHPFSDVPEDAWYANDIGIAYNAGYFTGTSSNTASPNASLSRQQAMTLLAKNMRLESVPGEVTEFRDGSAFAPYASGYVKACVQKGLVSGYPDGTFRPEEPITRGAMGLLLYRSLGQLVQSPGVHELGDVYGNVTVSSPGATLRNTTIAGDLFISGGLGLGAVTLENVRTLGSVVVAGSGLSEAGDDSVVLRNVETDNLKIDSLSGQSLSLRAEGETDVERTTVKSDAYIQDRTPSGQGLRNIDLDGRANSSFTLTGNLETVTNKTPSASVTVSAGSMTTLNMDEKGTGARVTVDGNGTVKTMNLDTGVAVTGTGDVENLVVNTTGSTTEMLPDKINIRPGVQATVARERMDSVQGQEASEDPRLLAGYPKVKNITPTTGTAVFSANKTGTVYWAVSGMSDGSVDETELVNPAAYGAKAIRSGTVSITASNTEVNASLGQLSNDGSYYLSAVMVDARGTHSPVKVVSFSTPDGTVPAFSSGYPQLTRNSYDSSSTAANRYYGQYMVQANKTCVLYWAVYRQNSAAPTPADFRAGTLAGSLGSGTLDMTRNAPNFLQVTGLEELTPYDVYMWLTDADFAQSSAVKKVTFTTVDGTPPEFVAHMTVTGVKNNALTLACVVNEQATVYWVAVKHGVEYPKAQPGSTNVTPEYAVRQIANGMNGEKAGSVRARANETATINISGLAPQTAYDIWFIAQDAAGNYSVYPAGDINNDSDPDNPKRTCMITANTLDAIPPTVSQDFTRFREEQQVIMPYANTDLRIVFSESVQRSSTGEAFLTLYQLIGRAANDEERLAAKETLASALRSCITLYDASVTGLPSVVLERTRSNQSNPGNWVIDYRNATVTLEDNQMVVTFPTNDDANMNSALHLSSGNSYYVEVKDIADTSAGANKMANARLDTFRTVPAEVALASMSLSTDNYPREVSEIDMAFTVTPITTSMSDPNATWDMLLWSDITCAFEMYTRARTAGPNGQYVVDEEGGTDALGWRRIRNPNGTGGTGRVSFTSSTEENMIGQSLHFHLYNYGVGETPRLVDLKDDLIYEYAIRFTELNSSRDRSGWSDDVVFRVSVVSGSSVELSNLAANIIRSRFDAAKTAQTIDDIGMPNQLQFLLTKIFTDTSAPTFTGGRPTFTPADMSVEMRLQLTRRGTIFYAIAPADGSIETHALEDLIPGHTTFVPAGAELFAHTTATPNAYWKYIPLSGSTIWQANGADGGNAILDSNGNTITTAPFRVSRPTVQDITNPSYDNPDIKTGYTQFSSGTLPITVTGLTAETDYLVYFVLQGTGQESVDQYVQIFRFTTTPVQRPILTLDLSNPVVNISTNRESVVDYMVVNYSYSNLHQLLQKPFWNDQPSDMMDPPPAYPTYAQISNVLQAMATNLASTDDQGRGSVFDKYATDVYKNQVAELIRAASPNSSTTIGVDHDITVSPSRRASVDCSEYPMSQRTQYAFLAVGRAPQGSGDAFRAIYPISLVDTDPPVITDIQNALRMDTETRQDENGNDYDHVLDTCSGVVSLTFDEYLYGLDDSDPTKPPELKQLDRGPILPTTATRDTNRFKSVETMMQFSSSGSAVRIATDDSDTVVNKPTQVLSVRFHNAQNGEFMTFAADLSDQFSNVHNRPLSVSVEIVPVRTLKGLDENGEPKYELVPTPVVRVSPEDWNPNNVSGEAS